MPIRTVSNENDEMDKRGKTVVVVEKR